MTIRPVIRALRHALGLALLAAAVSAQAQNYPDKPVRLVVAGPPGGTLDIVGRAIAEPLSRELGQPVIVDNKAGAAGMIGVNELLKSPHDGYTLMVNISGIVSEIPLIIKPTYDPFKDLKPLAELSRSGLVFVTGPSTGARTLQDAVRIAKSQPGKLSYASYSPGTISHTLGVELNRAAALDMAHVGYKGSPPALQDIIGGMVQFMFDGPATSVPMIESKRITALAVTTPQRMAALPEVPTFAELGYPKLTQVAWVGLWSTPDLSPAIQATVRAALAKVLKQPTVRERFSRLGMEGGQRNDSDELSRDLRAAYDKQAALLKSIDFKAE